MDKYSKEFISKTIEIWQSYSNTTLYPTDAIKIAENMINLFNFLITEDKKSQGKSVIQNNNCFKNKTGKEVKK